MNFSKLQLFFFDLLFHKGADHLALHSLGDIFGLTQIKHKDGQAVITAEGRGRGVHDGQTLVQHAGKGQRIIAHGIGGSFFGTTC